MNYYTNIIPLPLAEKLKEKGMPIEEDIYLEDDGYWDKTIKSPNYAEVFDWLMLEKEIYINISPVWRYDDLQFKAEGCTASWKRPRFIKREPTLAYCDTWYKAADAGIEKILSLI